jgi:hypothetical protein
MGAVTRTDPRLGEHDTAEGAGAATVLVRVSGRIAGGGSASLTRSQRQFR